MKTKGVYVPAHWAKRWDFVVAGYLAYFVSYVGEQGRRDGYTWDSAKDIQKKTGIKPGRQERARRILEDDGVIFTKHGGIGNKLHVLVNMPLLMLWDSLPSFDEAVEKVVASMDEEERLSPETAKHFPRNEETLSPKRANHFPRNDQTHNCNSSGTRSNSSQGDAPPEATDPRVDKCLEVLEEIENFRKDRKNISSTLGTLIGQYPRSNPVEVCRSVVNRAATQTITTPTSYLRGAFERDEAKLANEPKNPQGKDAPVFVAPRKEKEPKVDPREVQRLMDEGLTDAQIRAYIRMHTQTEEAVA